MADPAVCGFLTALLCAHGGRMELQELLGHIELPEAELLEVLNEAGPGRFVLLDQGPDAGPTVLATTPVRVCRRRACGGPCEALHLCKLNLLDRCRRERNYCKYSHEIHSEKNIKILKKHDLSVLSKNELAVLLLQSDPFFLPDICKYYKGENRLDSCSKKTECMKLHICEHFTEGRCSFAHCNRSHNLLDAKALELLKEEGLTLSVVRNIQDICNQKHARSKKLISRRRGRPEERNVGSRSQSKNQYFFGRQELSPSPSASIGTAHISEPGTAGPAPSPSSKGKVDESEATRNNHALSRDCVQLASASPKTVSLQGVSQIGTNLSSAVTGRRESRYGSQDSMQYAASISPPASAGQGVLLPGGGRVSSRRNVFFGSEADSFSDPEPITISKSGSVPSHNSANGEDDYGIQKAYSSPASSKMIDRWGMGSNAVVFSKYKPVMNLKKEESSSKSKDNQSTLINTQMAKTKTLIDELETPNANNVGVDENVIVRSGKSHNNQEQQRESRACVDKPMIVNLDRITRNDREESFCGLQSIRASPMSDAATTHVRPKASSTSNVIQGGVQKGNLAQHSLPTVMQATSVSTSASDHKETTSTLSKPAIHLKGLSGSQVGFVSTSSSSQTPGTLTTNKSRAVSPSKSTNAQDFKARVFNTTPSGMKNNDSNEICLDHLISDCKLKNSCKSVHFHLPYRWQVYISDSWKDLKDIEEIEKAYCDPSISKSHSIDFQKMLLGYYPVRRLSTPSTVQNPDHVMTTDWHWYWKNELDQWIEYGKDEGSEFISEDLESLFLLCPEEFVEFSEGRHKYKLDFNEMTQTNIVTRTKREVRRRPKFVSSVTVYWNQKHESQTQEQSKKVSFNFPSHWDQLNLPHTGYKIPSSSAACERNCSLVENTHMKPRSKQERGKIKELVSMWENLQFTEVQKEENHKISEAETTDRQLRK